MGQGSGVWGGMVVLVGLIRCVLGCPTCEPLASCTTYRNGQHIVGEDC